MVKPHRTQKAPRHVQRPGLQRGAQAAGVLPAHEGLGAGVHHRVHHTQGMHLPLVDPAVEVELRGLHGGLQQHAVRRAGLRQALAHHPLKGLDQTADHPQLTPAEAGVLVQLSLVGHPSRQHRKRRLHRFDIGRIANAVRHRAAITGIECGKRHIGLEAHLLQHLARMQLVLAGQDGGHRCTGQAGLLGHQGCRQGTKLFVVRHHTGPASFLGTPCLARRKALQIKADEPGVAGKGEQVKPSGVELELTGQPAKTQRVPVVVEKQPNTRCCHVNRPHVPGAHR